MLSKLSTDRALYCSIWGTISTSDAFDGLGACFLVGTEHSSALGKKKLSYFDQPVVLLGHSLSYFDQPVVLLGHSLS